MTKTVKEVVDDYVNRQKSKMYSEVRFEKQDTFMTYYNVKGILKDQKPVIDLDFDKEFHKYEFETWTKVSIFDSSEPIRKVRHTITGKVLEFDEFIGDD